MYDMIGFAQYIMYSQFIVRLKEDRVDFLYLLELLT